jgi:hypothetical protein
MEESQLVVSEERPRMVKEIPQLIFPESLYINPKSILSPLEDDIFPLFHDMPKFTPPASVSVFLPFCIYFTILT